MHKNKKCFDCGVVLSRENKDPHMSLLQDGVNLWHMCKPCAIAYRERTLGHERRWVPKTGARGYLLVDDE